MRPHDIEAVRKLLDQQGIQIFGATTGGEFIDGDIGAGTIAILLVDMKPEYFKVLLHDYRDKDPGTVVRQIAAEQKRLLKTQLSLSRSVRM